MLRHLRGEKEEAKTELPTLLTHIFFIGINNRFCDFVIGIVFQKLNG